MIKQYYLITILENIVYRFICSQEGWKAFENFFYVTLEVTRGEWEMEKYRFY
jgi:hypothetical protein